MNGEPAVEGAALATVAVVRRPRSSPSCSGVLVSHDLVITAAHCVAEVESDPDALLVIAGAPDVGAASSVEQVPVDLVTVHPGFPGPPSADPTSLGSRDDIAVLRLARSVESVTPLPVLDRELAADLLVPQAELVIAGYGSTDRDGKSSTGVLRSGRVVIEQVGDEELLAGRPGTADTCNGDSGGPAFVSAGGHEWLAGITSRARQDGTSPCGDGTIFEIASSHAGFLEDAGVPVDTAGATEADQVGSCSVWTPGRPPPATDAFPWIAAGTLLGRLARRDRKLRRPR